MIYQGIQYAAFRLSNAFRKAREDESGMQTIEMIIIIGIILMIAFFFKDKIGDLVQKLWEKAVGGAENKDYNMPTTTD